MRYILLYTEYFRDHHIVYMFATIISNSVLDKILFMLLGTGFTKHVYLSKAIRSHKMNFNGDTESLSIFCNFK